MTSHYISPKYKKEKLSDPSLADKIDVFEDRINEWLFKPMTKLIDFNDGMALLSLNLSYFEMIAQYIKGEDSNGKSKRFFIIGLKSVFENELSESERLSKPEYNLSESSREWHKKAYETFTDGFYKMGRCGMFHSYLPKYGFLITNMKGKLFIIEEIRNFQIYINPWVMANRLIKHFNEYVARLRENISDKENRELKNFETRFDLNTKNQ